MSGIICALFGAMCTMQPVFHPKMYVHQAEQCRYGMKPGYAETTDKGYVSRNFMFVCKDKP